ncbi:MAG TPA: rhomboid family intramembrane serine protease [Hyphomicrobiaceae bacterium]|nr:rhomboid family intramembrane serine protease [Hyphomicrobiaceae bacterium]
MDHRQPIFNVPGVVLALLASFVAVHLLRWALPPEESLRLTAMLAFIPARETGAAADLPGGDIAAFTSFFTHQFVHGDSTHLIINSAWLLAFGTPVARRTDWLRFLLFFLMSGAAGALLYLAINGAEQIFVIGASGAISGLMGAAFRFLFKGMDEGGPRALANASAIPLMTLAQTLRDRRILAAIAGWTVLNFALAWGAAGLTEAAGIAWEAHLGGFYAGLLLYGFFDNPPRQEDAALAE